MIFLFSTSTQTLSSVDIVILDLVILGLVLFISLISVIMGGNFSDDGGASVGVWGLISQISTVYKLAVCRFVPFLVGAYCLLTLIIDFVSNDFITLVTVGCDIPHALAIPFSLGKQV